jgi:WD40 repeat protein
VLVASGSSDETASVWGVNSGETVLGPIKAGHMDVFAVAYSLDGTKIATGGYHKHAVKIWDSTSGELLSTLSHQDCVSSLAWISDGKKLISVRQWYH